MLVILISILLSSLSLGIGYAFNIKKLWLFGMEELAQAIVSSALLGALAIIVASLSTGMVSFGSSQCAPADSPAIDNAVCIVHEQAGRTLEVSQLAYKASAISGFAGSLKIDAGIVQSAPFSSMQHSSQELFRAGSNFSLLYSLGSAQENALQVISSKALAVFFPIGLLLRSFFATRKAGAAIMALCVSLYVFFPILLSTLLASFGSQASFSAAQNGLSSYYSRFSFLPQTDFGKEASLRTAIDSLAQGDFASQTDVLFQPLGAYFGIAFNMLAVYPLACLALSFVLARELYYCLSNPLVFWRDA